MRPPIGHPARLSGREEVVRHATWFLGAVENFRFFDLKVYAFADPEGAVAEVKAEGFIKPTGVSIVRIMWCSCVLQAARSRFYVNISIPCVLPRLWTPRFLLSNPEDKQRRVG